MFQLILYGCQCYDLLIDGKQSYDRWLEVQKAAMSLQRFYRCKLAMRFASLPAIWIQRFRMEQVGAH